MKRFALAMAALVMGSALAVAHDDHAAHDGHAAHHDHAAKHGGVVVHSGHHHLELVAEGGSLTLFVSQEEGGEEDVSAAKASATVLAGGKTETVALAPAEGNKLAGRGGFTAGPGTTVVITLTLPGHEPEQARFKID